MKKSITGKATFVETASGFVVLKYDKNIRNWFKSLNEDTDEVSYMNYDSVAKQISKATKIEFDEYYDYPYFDYHYMNYMDFYTSANGYDAQIKKALKGKSFTIKLKVERF